jgi:pyruvate dehydrogenase E2 component (dihydrolipoamide acetyltransferase)
MPRQGNTVESCIITRWYAAEGDRVSSDDPVCEVETDKASFDVPAGADGIVLKILKAEGEDVPVLEPIAVIGKPGENWKDAFTTSHENPARSAEEAIQAAQAAVKAARAAVRDNDSESDEEIGVSPRARRRAETEGIDVSSLEGSGPRGRVLERDVAAQIRPPMTAAAREAANSAAVKPAEKGTALGGRVGLGDIKAATKSDKNEGASAVGHPVSPGDSFVETSLKGVRKIISERMLSSLASTAQLTFNSSADASRILDLRARFKSSEAALGFADITIGDLVLFAVSRVLPRFPNANATLEDGVLRSYEHVHLAMAVDTPRGLMVPVIRNADLLSLRELSSEAKRLAAACQSGSIDPAELSGGTFTVSNLGAFGVESFTPVLNAPQVAILGVDAILPRAAAGPNGSIIIERRMGLSLTVDHQVIDGVPAARLLKAFADAIADIDLLLMV